MWFRKRTYSNKNGIFKGLISIPVWQSNTLKYHGIFKFIQILVDTCWPASYIQAVALWPCSHGMSWTLEPSQHPQNCQSFEKHFSCYRWKSKFVNTPLTYELVICKSENKHVIERETWGPMTAALLQGDPGTFWLCTGVQPGLVVAEICPRLMMLDDKR